MKNLRHIIIAAILIIIHSCTEPQPPETSTIYDIINNSDYKITIHLFYINGEEDSVILNSYETEHYDFLMKDESSIPFAGDSLHVIYDDTVSITHNINEDQIASRSLFSKESYTGGKINEYEYKYEYIFTDADYQEALENQ